VVATVVANGLLAVGLHLMQIDIMVGGGLFGRLDNMKGQAPVPGWNPRFK
jgi:hypothetical protein